MMLAELFTARHLAGCFMLVFSRRAVAVNRATLDLILKILGSRS